jgi:galactokinase
MDSSIPKKLQHEFKKRFHCDPFLFSAPGRINILGEHLDYNHGFVLPAAIDKRVYLAILKNNEKNHRFYSLDFNETYQTQNLNISKNTPQWAKYVMGAFAQFQQNKSYFDLVFTGNIPIGAGLSSSAALESGIVIALNDLLEAGKSKFELVLMAQKAETDYAGVQCGIMDQYASIFGKKGKVIRLDCLNNTHTYLNLNLDDAKFILVDTGVKHSLAATAYNQRKQECQSAIDFYAGENQNVKTFRDLKRYHLKINKPDKNTYRRAHYILEENDRVFMAIEALKRNDIEKLGELLYATHSGLSKLFDVSCKELDFLVEQTKSMKKVLGSRMMGGGFGGCTLNLIKTEFEHDFKFTIKDAYKKKFNISPAFYEVTIENGADKLI